MPGCLLLDVLMPVEDGLQLYERLLREGKRLPVIFITAHADPTTVKRAAAVQPAGFVTKPYSARQLLQVVTSAGTVRK